MDGVDDGQLSEREQARLKRRDKRRRTGMVVDNAGVKRVALALALRRQASSSEPDPKQRS